MKDSKFEKIQDIMLDIITTMGMILCIIGFIIIGVLIIGKFSHRETIVNPYIPTISEEEKYFDKLTEDIIQCESQGKMVWGDLDLEYPAFGIAQVQPRTWKYLSDKMGFSGDINNPNDQRRFLRQALEEGYGKLWTCFSIVKRNAREAL